MTALLTYAGDVPADAPLLRTGGLPLVPAGFEWPVCAECEGAMMFLAHLPVDAGVVSVFMCQNDPGLCEEWDPTEGGNRAHLFAAEAALSVFEPPTEEETTLPVVTGLTTTELAETGYFAAVKAWAESGNDLRDALGQLGGAPQWLQRDATPACPGCERPMAFTLMLEQGREYRTAMNFGGGGWGYVFTCTDCAEAAFLWQS